LSLEFIKSRYNPASRKPLKFVNSSLWGLTCFHTSQLTIPAAPQPPLPPAISVFGSSGGGCECGCESSVSVFR